MRHATMRTGLWIVFPEPDDYPDGPYFDTREEAIDYGQKQIRDGTMPAASVGVIETLDPGYVAQVLLRSVSFDAANEVLNDDFGSDVDLILPSTSMQRVELVSVFRDWLVKHALIKPFYTLAANPEEVLP
jgi:hypothetical protein